MRRIAEYHIIEQVISDGEPRWVALVPGRQDGFAIAEHVAKAELEARGPNYRHWTWDLPADSLPCFRGSGQRARDHGADELEIGSDATLLLRQ
jgi:hypothetical protein